MKFEIFFVRHGTSCANMWQEKNKDYRFWFKHTKYSDPELISSAIVRSIQLSDTLKSIIEELWPDKYYTICSSPLIRAWETAYHMLAKPAKKRINIIPHVAETAGPISQSLGISSPDNIALPFAKQAAIIEAIEPDILNYIESDFRTNYSTNNNSFKEFKKWACKNVSVFGQSEDGIYRAVIFTHSNYISESFPQIHKELAKVGKTRILNNEAIFITWDTSVKNVSYDKSKFKYFDYGLTKDSVLYACPDDCRLEPSPGFGDGSICRRTSFNLSGERRNMIKMQSNLQRAYTRKKLVTKPFPLPFAGGRLLASGSFGCVYKPAIICKGEQTRRKNVISKYMEKKVALAELSSHEILLKLDQGQRYFVFPTDSCEPGDQTEENMPRCGLKFKTPTLLLSNYGGTDVFEMLESRLVPRHIWFDFLVSYANVIEGLCLLHHSGLTHFDVKNENLVCLITDEAGSTDLTIKAGSNVVHKKTMRRWTVTGLKGTRADLLDSSGSTVSSCDISELVVNGLRFFTRLIDFGLMIPMKFWNLNHSHAILSYRPFETHLLHNFYISNISNEAVPANPRCVYRGCTHVAETSSDMCKHIFEHQLSLYYAEVERYNDNLLPFIKDDETDLLTFDWAKNYVSKITTMSSIVGLVAKLEVYTLGVSLLDIFPVLTGFNMKSAQFKFFVDFLKRLLCLDVDKRPTMDEALHIYRTEILPQLSKFVVPVQI